MNEHAVVGRNVHLLFKVGRFEQKINRLLQNPEKDHWEEIVKVCKEMEKYILEHYKNVEKDV